MPDLTGQILNGRYQIEELLGRGGMAEVYKAWDVHRQYHVAVKVMREDLAEDIEFLERFRREASALAALNHANIVRFYSFEREGRLAFLVMDYVEGTTLNGNEEIYAMYADGSGPWRITNYGAEDRTPAWGSDGWSLVFSSKRGEHFAICVINADGSGERQLTYNSAHDQAPD